MSLRIPNPRVVLPFLVVLVGALLFVGLVKSRRGADRQTPPTLPLLVRVVDVAPESIRLDVASRGQLAPATESDLVAQVPGTIVDVAENLAAGGRFAQDETLAVIDPRDFRIAVTAAQAVVAQAEVTLQLQEREARVARLDWEALGEGEPDPLVVREPQVAQARAARDAARAALQKARLDLDRTRIRAPFAGRVLRKVVDLGQYVGPGTPIARVYASDAGEVRLPISIDDLAFLDLPTGAGDAGGDGEAAPVVTLTASLGGKVGEWIGRVVRTEGAVDPSTRMLHVVARLEDPWEMPVGLFLEAQIQGRLVENVFHLPRGALQDGHARVLIVDEEDRLRSRDVEIVRFDGDWVVVRGGLMAGDRLCLSSVDVAVDGMKVRVQKPNPESGAVS